MKQTIRHILPLLFLLPLLCACQEELPFAPEADAHYLSLSLATQANTRAVTGAEVGEDAFNENLIERADVYFFQVNATQDEEECIYAQLGLRPTLVSGSQTDYTLQVPLDKTIISEGTEYYVYVVANHDFGYTGETAKGVTLEMIKQQTITTEWKSGYQIDGTAEDNVENVKEPSLVMDGRKDITIQSQPTTPETIDMTRAMAKVTLSASMKEAIESNGLTYTPIPSGMFTTLVYAVQCTNLAGDYTVNATDYITRMRRNYNETPVNGEQRERYSQVAPFYSYPNLENTTDRRDSYLILCVPWMARADGGPSYQAMNYYYRVPITGSEAPALLERNHYYKINVHIGVLGSLNPNEAVELEAEFEIMNWFQVGIDADINQYQYLVLDEYSSVMNNVDEIRMPYISSSQLKMEGDNQGDTEYTRITKVTYPNYNAETSDDSHTSTTTLTGSAISDAGFSIDEKNGELIFNHPISSEDYVPYTITVEVWNMQGMHVEWEITQYPPIYIEGEYNAEGMHVETDWWGNKTYSKGNRFVYGVWEGSVTDDAGNSFGNANNYDNASNKNPNQYTIRITSFDIEGSEYAIGDPRSSTVDNLRYLQNKTGRDAQTGEQRKLQYYYPTRKDDVEQVIAPAFKIASSWGVVTTNDAYYDWGGRHDEVLTYETAQRRCASYQENGYPAGRWRIPTEAEIEYIISLSDRGMIPPLFNGSYYASSGRYYNNEANPPGFATAEAGKGYSVRCVYDVWYWGNGKISDPDEFTWGDAPMQ